MWGQDPGIELPNSHVIQGGEGWGNMLRILEATRKLPIE